MLGGFFAAALGAALAIPGVSAAGAATLSHRTGPAARHPGTALPVPPLKPQHHVA
jgi:hypothetical protein